jgi:hypothetical protein
MKGTIGLYATYGERTQMHKLVLYFMHDKDWTRKQRVANGNTGKPLCVCPMTNVAQEIRSFYRSQGRAACMMYGGLPGDMPRFKMDMKSLGVSDSDVNLFCEKALQFLS